jgi:N-acyl-D-aspartate/D-glutamate deacylase
VTVDLVIRGGTVVDGSGGEPRRSDVAVEGDRIVAIGRVTDRGRTEIDADGYVVTPGFIDGHTHMDAQLFWDPLGTSSCWHGVTSVVMGNCGFTLAPGSPAQRDLVVGNLERAEDISGTAIAQAIDWSWTSFAEYLDVVDALPKGINYAANIGHSALRTWAMGERAYTDRATDAELQQMEHEIGAAMAAGAVGFTTSRTHMHETTSGQPVASRLAEWDEVSRLVGAMAAAGGGIFQLAPETEGGRDERDDFRRRLRALAAETGVTCTFGVGANAAGEETLAYIDESATRGATMFGQTNSRGQAVLLSFRTHLPFDHVEGWRQLRDQPDDAMRAALADPTSRAALVDAARNAEYRPAIGADPRPPDYARIMVMTDPVGPHETVAARATRLRLEPVEAMIQLALDTDLEQLFMQPIAEFDPAAAARAMRHPRTVMTFSDSGAHVSQISDCSIHPPPRPLGARRTGLHARRGRADADPRTSSGLGSGPARAARRGDDRRHQRVRPRHHRAAVAHRGP